MGNNLHRRYHTNCEVRISVVNRDMIYGCARRARQKLTQKKTLHTDTLSMVHLVWTTIVIVLQEDQWKQE